jgi:hypothetical protein
LPRYGIEPKAPSKDEAQAPAEALPLHLTAPHRCQVCRGEIHQPLGRRRCTVLHRPINSDMPDNCRTDVYAALYRCPSCRVRLETPSFQWGLTVRCPACHNDFTAPHDNVLHERQGDAREGQPFRFACPACGNSLECDTIRHGRPTPGLPVVCLHCSHLIHVPGGGISVAVSVVADGPQRRCSNPACAQLVPAGCDSCPLCGTVFPADPPAR